MSLAAGLVVLACAPHLGGCGVLAPGFDRVATTGSLPNGKRVAAVTAADRECLARAMYFESNRSSDEGLLAVGTVVMNRLQAASYPESICGVVGQPRQFAAGVLRKPMRDQDREKVEQVADAVLAGQRHDGVGGAMFFHTAGLRFPYRNMHYVALAGGNAFYEKRPRGEREGMPSAAPSPSVQVAMARLPARPTRVARATGQTPLAELGPARNVCRVAAAEARIDRG
ncbi:cell wall hydrolase SleB [Methylobacterium sp. 4-46]|uniref:cell wall hydrolase n=1 Tax=unclassified Methylobacterium TaxID=2615210 RepID=UPI000165CDE7|nr:MULTISPECIES: cell wall hydrolase [Methylobacterium]ACA20444.1 cell wall hydrolase SleB [Methylobacterium sp. 4-46]WFT79614.1 cell wall hydrolase [Methylobacterium nodulans]